MPTYRKIRELTYEEASVFYSQVAKPGDHVSFTCKGKYFGCEDKPGFIVGIISTQQLPSSIRIKTFLVKKSSRGKGIGTALMKHVVFDGVKYTAFATDQSRPIFEKFGFVEHSRNARGIAYMVKG